ncbi:MAG: hypothetical protein GXX91_00790, partial [Verrucomicrobiaceae bacterium]|nr:hypothetical protein [Verrucomicrobiaceae bacterium]
MKHLPFFALALAIFALFPAGLTAREAPHSGLQNYVPWEEETVHTFENILVQQDGRVKPLYTVARFSLL